MKSHRAYSDHEIACYVLGLDMHHQTQDIQARLAHDDAAAARALKWEAYFLGIVDGLTPSAPPPELLMQIQATLGMEHIPIRAEERPHTDPENQVDQTTAHDTRQARHSTPRHGWAKHRRLAMTAGLCVAAGLLVFLTWANLRSTTSTVVQQDIQLPSQPQS
ncbi:hypothetical protein [Castellaniella sp.]|uniref:hypothetical protein n=1 Tax=Castellaniella sp. TaxID=1955812 RepID=UPI002B00091E|nr:hypothetical protein [Castellaniella sp.]